MPLPMAVVQSWHFASQAWEVRSTPLVTEEVVQRAGVRCQ